MVTHRLGLHTDRLEPGTPAALPAAVRVIYVWQGSLTLRAAGQAATLAANSAWHGTVAAELAAGAEGVVLLRWELVPAGAAPGAVAGGDSRLTLEHGVELADPAGHLVRCDRVDFPPGGVAHLHTHQGPGIRCLLAGQITVEVGGQRSVLAPGQAWFEAGPDPVLARASEREPTSFARVMLLPRALRGRPSIRYVRAEDQDRPRSQRYQVFCDEPLAP